MIFVLFSEIYNQMKHILSFLILIFSLSLSAQSIEHVGEYKLKLGEENHLIENKLILNQNGTFLFHHYDKISNGIPPERNSYGKGTWISKDKLMFFSTDENHIYESNELDFNNSKARFISKTPRNKLAKVVKTAIRFYESNIFWMTGITLIKQ